MEEVNFVVRWGHLVFGITWVGMLYYFNFVQGEYFKEADGSAKSDAIQKLVPRALWWFRWAAMLTFITGVGLLGFYQLSLKRFFLDYLPLLFFPVQQKE